MRKIHALGFVLSGAALSLLAGALIASPIDEPPPAFRGQAFQGTIGGPASTRTYCDLAVVAGTNTMGVVTNDGRCQPQRVLYATTSNVVLTASGSNSVVVSSIPTSALRASLVVSCSDERCNVEAYGAGMDRAKAMLDQIANRSMRIEVSVHDANCHVQREMIEPRPREDLVAEAR